MSSGPNQPDSYYKAFAEAKPAGENSHQEAAHDSLAAPRNRLRRCHRPRLGRPTARLGLVHTRVQPPAIRLAHQHPGGHRPLGRAARASPSQRPHRCCPRTASQAAGLAAEWFRTGWVRSRDSRRAGGFVLGGRRTGYPPPQAARLAAEWFFAWDSEMGFTAGWRFRVWGSKNGMPGAASGGVAAEWLLMRDSRNRIAVRSVLRPVWGAGLRSCRAPRHDCPAPRTIVT